MSVSYKNENELRAMVKVLLEDKSMGPGMLKVNPVVDPSAAVTDPSNLNFKPQSSVELKVALSSMVDELPDDSVPTIYDKIKHALDVVKDDEGNTEMKKNNVEEAIRLAIKALIKEAIPTLPRPKLMPPSTPPGRPTEDPALKNLHTGPELADYFRKVKGMNASVAKSEAEAVLKARKAIIDPARPPTFTRGAPGASAKPMSAPAPASAEEKAKLEELPPDETSLSAGVRLQNQVIAAIEEIKSQYVTDDLMDSFKDAFDMARNELDLADSPGGGTFQEVISSKLFEKEFKSLTGKSYPSFAEKVGYDFWRSMQEKTAEGKRGYSKAMAATPEEIADALNALADKSLHITSATVAGENNKALGKFLLHNSVIEKFGNEMLGADILSSATVEKLMKNIKSENMDEELVVQIFDAADAASNATGAERKQARVQFRNSVVALINDLLGINFAISDSDQGMNAELQDLLAQVTSSAGDIEEIKSALKEFVATAVISKSVGA